MSVKYDVTVTVDLTQSVKSVGEILDDLSSQLAKLGWDVILGYGLNGVSIATLTVDRHLTPHERKKIEVLLEEQFNEEALFANGDVQVQLQSASEVSQSEDQ